VHQAGTTSLSEIDFKDAWEEFDPSLHGSITASQFRQLMAGPGERASGAEEMN
jgi:hypothetical protein